MEERPPQVPLKNWILFFILSVALLYGYPFVLQRFGLGPQKPIAKLNVDVKSPVKDGAIKDGAIKDGAKKDDTHKDGANKPADGKDGVASAKVASIGAPPADSSKPSPADTTKSPVAKGTDAPAATPPDANKPDANKAEDSKPDANKPDADKVGEKSAPAIAKAPPATISTEWFTLGSLDPASPYRMLVTVGNRGAAIARIELNNDHYHDLDDWTGYLGHLVIEAGAKSKSCEVQVVGDGTPAAKAGIQAGDHIVQVGGVAVSSLAALEAQLAKTKPGQSVEVTYEHNGQAVTKSVALIRRPLEIVRPQEKLPRHPETNQRLNDVVELGTSAPLSLLMTMQQVDDNAIPPLDESKEIDLEQELATELNGIHLRDANWEVVQHDQESIDFRSIVRVGGHDILELHKRYKLSKPTEKSPASDPDSPLYHLEVSLEIKNIDPSKHSHDVAYRLDGPTGLPDEGSWYASKVGTKSGCGLRDVVYKMSHNDLTMFTATQLADKPMESMFDSSQINNENRPTLIGIDGQYFAGVLQPAPDTTAMNLDRALAMSVGKADPARKNMTNTSFRLISKSTTLASDQTLSQSYTFFAGPKRPGLLRHYDLETMIYYGWFGPICIAMKWILDFFNGMFHNFGLAIVGLTVMVRLLMFPLSRIQTKNMQMMQKMQPEMKAINEKYKNDIDGKNKAVNELYKKHNTNQFAQLGGCLLLFLQLPVFFGMYRALQINVELRDAPLISESVRWCSNLAAPDMLLDWSHLMPAWFNLGNGMFALGPFFNILPVLTIGMFLAQQKLLMPPPADEAAATQQKMMNFMMLFMLLMFYRVASGLCIYSIASTLWGLAERQLLPKKQPPAGETDLSTASPYGRSPNGGSPADARRKKNRKK